MILLAVPGQPVAVSIVVENSGGQLADFRMVINGQTTHEATLDVGEQAILDYSFVMTEVATDLSFSLERLTDQGFVVDATAQQTVTPSINPIGRILRVDSPTSARAGDNILVTIQIENAGNESGVFNLQVNQQIVLDAVSLAPLEVIEASISLVMPNNTLNMVVELLIQGPTIGSFGVDDARTIVVALQTVGKSAALALILGMVGLGLVAKRRK